MKVITEASVIKNLISPSWSIITHNNIPQKLVYKHQFADFNECFGKMTQIALYADKVDHHPNWSNVYNNLDITLWTHDANGLTDKDIKFAQFVDRIIGK